MAEKRRHAHIDPQRMKLLADLGRTTALCARTWSDYAEANARRTRWQNEILSIPARIAHLPMLVTLGQAKANEDVAWRCWQETKDMEAAALAALRTYDAPRPAAPAGA